MAGETRRGRPGHARLRAARAWRGPAVVRSPAPAGIEPPPRGRVRLAVGVALLVVLCAAVLHTRPFLLRRLSVSGVRQVTSAEVEADLALPAGTYTWQLRPWVLARRLRADPLIAHASFRILWPDGLAVRITERVPAALLLDGNDAWEVTAGGRLLRALADPTGSTQVAAPGLPAHLPMITGVPLAAPTAGEVVQAAALRQALAVTRGLGGTVGAQVAEIVVRGNGDVAVRTASGLLADFGDGSQAALKTGELLGILACAQREGVTLTAIDLAAASTPAVQTAPGGPAWKACPSVP